ncbi:unnamed protein product [Calypogeia fissa]
MKRIANGEGEGEADKRNTDSSEFLPNSQKREGMLASSALHRSDPLMVGMMVEEQEEEEGGGRAFTASTALCCGASYAMRQGEGADDEWQRDGSKQSKRASSGNAVSNYSNGAAPPLQNRAGAIVHRSMSRRVTRSGLGDELSESSAALQHYDGGEWRCTKSHLPISRCSVAPNELIRSSRGPDYSSTLFDTLLCFEPFPRNMPNL